MIENSTLKIGGNTIKVWIGKIILNLGQFFQKKGQSIISNNKPKIVTNPAAKLFNPFTLIISFTVDTHTKYQIVLQGDFKDKYKESENGDINLSENELFMIINTNQNLWYKKSKDNE